MSTPREHFLQVFRGEQPGRVPVTLFIHDHGHFLSQCYPDLDPWDWAARQAKVVELQKQLGCDVFARLASYVDQPGFMTRGEIDAEQRTDDWRVSISELQVGEQVRRRIAATTPGGTLVEDRTTQQVAPNTYITAVTKPAVASLDDLVLLEAYQPLYPACWAQQARERVQAIKALVGEDGIVGLWTLGGAFNYASRLVSLGTLYTLFLTDPEFYDRLMRYALRRIEEFAGIAVGAGADVLIIGGNVPGGFLGRRTYERYVLPYERECITALQRSGTPAIYHNCGQIMALVESYKALGVRIVEPFSPPPTLGDGDLARALDCVHGEYAIIAGIDQVNVLQKGTLDDVRRATERTVALGKQALQRGQFIVQSADFLEYGTPVENVATFIEAAMQYAEY
ncbi:MAG: hypothetical protein GX573_19070 [Chloroflexi bacterium]|nr:hypothetical protein [Chloroflexota bacterium]